LWFSYFLSDAAEAGEAVRYVSFAKRGEPGDAVKVFL
jgi:hypothetical protein